VLRAQQRPHDVVGTAGRRGGSRWCCRGLRSRPARAPPRRIRAAVEELAIVYEGTKFRATMSLGCASVQLVPASAGDPDEVLVELMRRADTALYEAKRLGPQPRRAGARRRVKAHTRA
jgi:GGDEF domain-containing protein